MSKTTDYVINMMEETINAETLHEVLLLDMKYCGENGTSMEVQDHFRELKYEFSMNGLKEVNLNRAAFRFYNYSMQGHIQIYLDTDVYDKLLSNLNRLSDYYDIGLTEKDVIQHPNEIILDINVSKEV